MEEVKGKWLGDLKVEMCKLLQSRLGKSCNITVCMIVMITGCYIIWSKYRMSRVVRLTMWH